MDTRKINSGNRPELEKSDIVEQLPKACTDETAAVEFIEARRWGDTPCCPKCGDVNVYKMVDAKTGQRSSRYLWRCRGCKKMYTARTGTVFEESLIPLRHWCYAFWRVAASKKGVAAMEIMRQCQISYKSALFMMHRIRYGLTPTPRSPSKKFRGDVEVDETFIGGKPRPGTGFHRRGRGTNKAIVLGIVEREGKIHRRVVADVSAKTLKSVVFDLVHSQSRILTDENSSYNGLGKFYARGHETVNHHSGEYAYNDVNTNTIESSFALVKRGLHGIYHAVSRDHLPRYLAQFDFLWNTRKMNDGERAVAAIQASQGKRLMYREPVAKAS